jgi:hypothetical protein
VKNGSEAWMFGGCDKRRPPGPNNELYKLDMSDKETFYWMRINLPTLHQLAGTTQHIC